MEVAASRPLMLTPEARTRRIWEDSSGSVMVANADILRQVTDSADSGLSCLQMGAERILLHCRPHCTAILSRAVTPVGISGDHVSFVETDG